MLVHVPPEASVLAMDVHKNSISAAVLDPAATVPVVDRLGTDEESVRRLLARFEDPRRVWACYEAGPTGYISRRDAWPRVRAQAPGRVLRP